jgi:hypothetical protein
LGLVFDDGPAYLDYSQFLFHPFTFLPFYLYSR